MKLIYFTSFIDGLMIFLAGFVLFNCIFRTIGLTDSLSAFFAVIIAIIFFILFLRLNLSLSQKKQYRATLSKKKRQFVKDLISMKTERIVSMLNDYVFDKSLPITRLNGKYTYNGYTLLFLFLPQKISANLIAYAIKSLDSDSKVAVFSTSFDNDALIYCKENNVLAFSANEIYDAIEKSEYKQQFEVKPSKRFNLSNFQFKSNYKRALLFGISLAVLGNFSFFPLYYQISGSLFIIYGIVIAFFGKISPKCDITLNDFKLKN